MLPPSYFHNNNNVLDREFVMERAWRDISPTCPRCGSTNTKFCYYNNYSLTQPRYFCKGCRRYWTKGGSLRSVPVGGGFRKSRRSRSSALRLTTTPSNHRSNPTLLSNDHHHHHHHHHRQQINSTYSCGNLNIMGEDSTTSPMNSEAPRIDLAAVYANFLNQKPGSSTNEEVPTNCGYSNINNNSNTNDIHNPTSVELSNIPDATKIAPTSQLVLHEHPSFSHALLPMCELSIDNVDNMSEFNGPILHHEEISSMQHEELGLLPFPGEALITQHDYDDHDQPPQQPPLPSWSSSSLIVGDNNVEMPIRQHHQVQDLETDSQYLSMFNNGSWSPIDLQGFDNSSSSKP